MPRIADSVYTSATGTIKVKSPVTSSFTSICTSPQLLSNLNIMVSGQPIFQTPSNYSWSQFLEEFATCEGVNGMRMCPCRRCVVRHFRSGPIHMKVVIGQPPGEADIVMLPIDKVTV